MSTFSIRQRKWAQNKTLSTSQRSEDSPVVSWNLKGEFQELLSNSVKCFSEEGSGLKINHLIW